ncbi:hypothetical protein ACO0RG_001134 [Hanseniaspora osmophila]
MPIRSLESFLFERNLVDTCPIDSISGCRLGIDVDHYFSKLLLNKKELFTDAIGGCPTGLIVHIENDLKFFKENEITPVFVFNGFETVNQVEYSSKLFTNPKFVPQSTSTSSPESTAQEKSIFVSSPLLSVSGDSVVASSAERMVASDRGTFKQIVDYQRIQGWSAWKKLLEETKGSYVDQPPTPTQPFKFETKFLEINRFKNELIQILINKEIEYLVAPFVSWIQLAYLFENQLIDAIYGSTDLLLLEKLDKFILSISFLGKEVRYVEKASFLKETKISFNDFVDISMCCGNSLQPETLLSLSASVPDQQIFAYALDLVSTQGFDLYVNLKNSNEQKETDYFERGLATLSCSPIMSMNGKVILYSTQLPADTNTTSTTDSGTEQRTPKNKVPKNVHDYISKRLPDEYHFYFMIGLFSNTKVLDAIISNQYVENLPLAAKNIAEYQELVRKSSSVFKNNQFNILASSLNRYYQSRPIKHIKWFEPQNSEELPSRLDSNLFDEISKIYVKTDNEKPFTLANFVALFQNQTEWKTKFFNQKVIFPGNVPITDKLNTSFDLLSTSLLRFLFLIGFFELKLDATKTKATRLKATKWGDVFLKLKDITGVDQDMESLLLFLILMKFQVIKLNATFDDNKYPSSLSESTKTQHPMESKNISLLCRVLLLCKSKNNPECYQGPVDYSLLCFRDFYENVSQNSRELLESCTASTLVYGEFNRVSLKSNNEWSQKIVKQMLFKEQTPNTLFTMIWEFYLQKMLHSGNSHKEAVQLISKTFNTAQFSTEGEIEKSVLRKGLIFLQSIQSLFNELTQKKLVDETEAEALNKAVTWVEEIVGNYA